MRLGVIISSTPVGNLSQSHNLYCNTYSDFTYCKNK